MTKVLPRKPGPKSSKQSKIIYKRGTLGDTSLDDDDDDDSGANETDGGDQTTPSTPVAQKRTQPYDDNSEFRTPEPENNATDYGLEFTTSNIQNPTPHRCSTFRSERSSQDEQSANKNTQIPVDDDETPTTSKSIATSRPLRKSIQQTTKSKTTAKTKNTVTPMQQTSAVVIQPVKKPRKQRNPRQLEVRFWRDVKVLQNRTDLLIPMLPFSRLVREIMQDSSTTVTKITSTALEALQTSSEMYLTQRLQDAYMLTLHRRRVTLEVKDMQLINYLKIQL